MNKISDRALSNVEIEKYARILKIRNFRGCYMRDELKELKYWESECGILNLNLSHETGSHWTCWFKKNEKKYYFNSFGLPPPKELINYLGSPVLYSTFQLQDLNEQNCGKWCLFILKKLNDGSDYISLILSLVK